MKGLYLILDIFTLLCPVLLSFDKRVRYVKQWGNVLLAATIIAIPFLLWDVLFTAKGVWGFNPDYLVGISFFGLPIEEILFFWVVPLACVFIYECCKYYFRRIHWFWFNVLVQIVLVIYIIYLNSVNVSGWYTITTCITGMFVLYFWFSSKHVPQIGIAYILCLIPFLVVNGVLTGSWIEAPIVWYNSEEFSDLRIGTIPMEDAVYGFTLIVANILLHERLIVWRQQKVKQINHQ
jgi:lycopene cyclase domain-containing protein